MRQAPTAEKFRQGPDDSRLTLSVRYIRHGASMTLYHYADQSNHIGDIEQAIAVDVSTYLANRVIVRVYQM